MATIRFILGIFCLTALGWSGLPGSGALESRGLLVRSPKIWIHEKTLKVVVNNIPMLDVGSSMILVSKEPLHLFAKNSANFAVTSKILSIARNEIGVREKTGHNDGKRVEAYLRYAGGIKGDPWCAAFVSWVFGKSGYTQPRTVWSPAIFPPSKRTADIQPAVVFGIYFPALKRIAHCGFVERKRGDWICTIEGNTNVSGSREGDGVYRKWRPVKSIRYFANWTEKKGVKL